MSNQQLYSSFANASKQFHELSPIDYFLAKEVCQDFFTRESSSTENSTKESNSTEYNTGVSPLSPQNRQQLFHLIILLSQSLRAGHSCLLIDDIAGQRFGYAADEQGIVSHHGFIFANKIELSELLTGLAISEGDNALIVAKENRVYLRRYFQFEHELSQAITSRLSTRRAIKTEAVTECLQQLFPTRSDGEIDWQLVAVANAINKGFSVIAGGPGTGKTYTVTKLLAALVKLHQQQADSALNIMLCAPTGKAAQRLSESISQAVDGFAGQIDAAILDAIPRQATTLHRLLGVIPHNVNFRHHQDNLLAVDILLIDEVSMVDLPMMTRVLRALPSHTQVILLGDADQLPSVATGSVLADIAPRPHTGYSKENIAYLTDVCQTNELKSQQVKGKKTPLDHVTLLTKSRRFDGEGLIGRVASLVINGQAKESWQLLTEPDSASKASNADMPLLLSASMKTWLPTLVKHYYQPLFNIAQVQDAFTQLSRFSILCATRQGEFGVDNINLEVKNILSNLGCINAQATIFHGQPIMISENDYGVGLYNGDIGIIWRHESGHLMAVFETDEGQLRWLMPSRLPPFETVFAMTIHKTQGSEFNHVAMVLPPQADNKLLSRELIYTGVTRAKNILSISALPHVWQHGVEAKVTRRSGLTIS
ncbi:exodeoxyribonuclease V subunit alpha [Thalassotalea sp. PLHSN55]|uniref:exodeoxyribonuclease V subunit alpha n=1 Tax=Thalassotalea sp. PLHSN55 TaxID=3435888 RepID=UPI003F84846F